MMNSVDVSGFEIFTGLLISLGLTLALELIFALISGIRREKDLLLVCMVNIITNPVVVFLYYLASRTNAAVQMLALIILEVLAVAVEALYYKTYSEQIRRPILFAIGANVFSFFIGRVINMLVYAF